MKVVVDTNVLVSGYLNPHGAPGDIVRRIGAEELVLCYDARVAAEYEEVLQRPEFEIAKEVIDSFMEHLNQKGELTAGTLLSRSLPDPDDQCFLEVALGVQAPLITGNTRHFPATHREGIQVFTPSEFLKTLSS